MKINQQSEQAKIIKEVPDKGFTCPECHNSNVNYVLVDAADSYERCTDCGHRWQPKGDPQLEEVWEWNELKPWLREIDS